MTKRLLPLAAMLYLSASPLSADQIRGNDSFLDGMLDPTRWQNGTVAGGPAYLQQGGGGLIEEGGRLYYNVTAPLSFPYNAPLRWILNNGSYTNSWIAQVNVRVGPETFDTNPFLPPISGAFFLGMTVFNQNDPGDSFACYHHTQRQSSQLTYGVRIEGSLDGVLSPGLSTASQIFTEEVSLQIQYYAPDRMLVFYYDESGPSDGFQWSILNFHPVSSWGMNTDSHFSIALFARSSSYIVNKKEMYFSDFLAISAPVMNHPLQNQVGPLGGTASFVAPHEPDNTITYQWKKSGDELAGQTASVLTINGISQDDVASYSVVMMNEAGTVESNAATLSIGTPLPPSISVQLYQGQLLIQWPLTASGFGVYGSTTLTPESWGPVSGTPVVINGLNSLLHPIDQPRLFFRLQR